MSVVACWIRVAEHSSGRGGRVYGDLRPASPFHGWRELGSAIEELRAAALARTEPFAGELRLRVIRLSDPTSQEAGA